MKPWYLTTAVVAEQLYDALHVWDKEASLDVTDVSQPFFKQFADVATGTYASSSSEYKTLTDAVKVFADGFLSIVEKYAPTDGALAEQFGKDSGVPLSAVDLTCAFSSLTVVFLSI